MALQPGHSLMDWIRLGNSGKDLTSVGGHLRDVTEDELAEHKEQNNAWIAIRGKRNEYIYFKSWWYSVLFVNGGSFTSFDWE